MLQLITATYQFEMVWLKSQKRPWCERTCDMQQRSDDLSFCNDWGFNLKSVLWAKIHAVWRRKMVTWMDVLKSMSRVGRLEGSFWYSTMVTFASSFFDVHLEIFQWMRSLNPPCPLSEDICDMVAACGDLDILKYLRSHGPSLAWNENVSYKNMFHNSLGLMAWESGDDLVVCFHY